MRDREFYSNKKAKTRNESEQQKGGSNRPQFQKHKGPAPSSASALALKNKGEYNNQSSRINLLILRVAWYKEVVSLLHAPSVAKTIQVLVVMDPLVVSSVVRIGTSCESV